MKISGDMDMTLTFDPAGEGLAKVLKDYQIEALRLVWAKGDDGAISKEVWQRASHVGSRGLIGLSEPHRVQKRHKLRLS